MWVLVLLLSILNGVRTIDCPDYYSDGGDGSCYLGISSRSRNEGYSSCSDGGAYLADVINAFQNTAVGHRAGSAQFVWLGLTCLNSSITSCQWDTGASMTLASYNNFDGGRPTMNDGPCVLMDIKTGKWYSADCSDTDSYVICKYTPNIKVLTCDWNYSYLRGKCYSVHTASSAANAAYDCQLSGGVQASIHSEGENEYIKGIAVYNGPSASTQLFVGIQNGIWTDGTTVDYENYAYKNPALGSCTSMSLYGDPVPAGMWISSQCTAPQGAVAVCKYDSIEPTPIPTYAPPQCSGTQFLSGDGNIYSPGYPLGSQPNHCEYIITEDEGYEAQINLLDIQLDKNSALQLFSGLFDQRPFVNLTNIDLNSRTYQSSTNVLKIVYDTAGSENNKNSWNGHYFPIISVIQTTGETEATTEDVESTAEYGCGNSYLYSGTIESSGFPGSYPQITANCTYYLYSEGSSTCFKFDVFDIRYYDYVYLYDGSTYLMDSFTGYSNADGIYCTNRYTWMTVVFSTFGYNQGEVQGWSGSFAADSEQLVGSTPW